MSPSASHRWPTESEARAFYGNPVSVRDPAKPSPKWESENLVYVTVPWRAEAAWDAALRIRRIRVHRKCADSLGRVLGAIWEASGRDQATIEAWGCHLFGGSYLFRPKRSGRSLSMHAYGCAIDLDPERNRMGDATPSFANIPAVLRAFESEGWTWGGLWAKPDGMHFEAVRR